MNTSRMKMREIQRMADRVCVLSLSSDLPAVDSEIEKSKIKNDASNSTHNGSGFST